MQTITLISSRAVEKLKQKARKLKRAEALPHHQALDRVAQAAGFDHWHHVCLSAKNFEPAERAFFNGFVIAFDAKEGEDFDTSDGVFIADHNLQFLCRDDLLESLLNSHEDDDPQAPLLRDTRTTEELEEDIEDTLFNLSFFRLHTEPRAKHIREVLGLANERSFWSPNYVWFRGEFFDTNDIPATDN